MKYKKILGSVTAAVVLAATFTANNLAGAANLNQAAATLPSNEEWSIMAKASIGQNAGSGYLSSALNSDTATDYEKRILAITATGGNPATISSENFIARLESFVRNGQLGDPDLLNDDIFGILALHSAGISNSTVSDSRRYLLNNQNSDGGWGYGRGVGSDSNTTAMAVAALAATGSVPGGATDYLYRSQTQNGGFGYTPGDNTDGASTAWVIIGLNSANRSVPSEAKTYLENLQTESGSFKWKPDDSSGSALVTAYAVIALSGKSMPIRTVDITPPAAAPVVNLTANPRSIDYASSSLLSWSSTNTTSCTASGSWAGSKALSGSQSTGELTSSQTYTLTCSGLGGSKSDSETVSVSLPPTPPPPPPPPTGLVHVTISYPNNKIFVGDENSANQTALQALVAAAGRINLLYQIQQTGLGEFVKSINGYGPAGTSGWQYAVNGTVPQSPAANYNLSGGDSLQWFYGAPSSTPY